VTVNAYPCPLLTLKSWLSSGMPNAFGTITTYSAGTTTPLATWTDYTAGTPNANPLTLNARGECNAYLSPNVGYKFVEADQYGNLIRTTDQVFNSILLNLFAGTDSGIVNAYVVNFNTPYTAYTNGWTFYFIASNTNTGASTINVNGLGVVSIVNPNGTALSAGQIALGQMTEVIYENGQFILTSFGAATGIGVGTFGPQATTASANLTDLGATGSHNVLVTGSAIIASFGTSASIQAPIYLVTFNGSAVIANSNGLITPNGANLFMAPNGSLLASYLGSGTWQVLMVQSPLVVEVYAAKQAATTRASTTSITADPDLQLTLGVGTYAITGWINDAGGTSSGGLKGALAFSGSTSSGYWNATGSGTDFTAAPLTQITSSPSGVELESAQSGAVGILITGQIQVTAGGTLSFNWAQNSSNATASTVSAGSWLQAQIMSTSAGTFAPVTYSYNTASSGTNTIPSGATTLTLEVWGGSGNGGGYPAYGGSSGGYCRSTYTVSASAGDTIDWTVGSISGTSTVSSGTYSLTTMTSTGGAAGTGSPGAVGTATGGTVANTSGNAGQSGQFGPGGAGIVGIYGTGSSGGYSGANIPGYENGTPGGPGLVIFHYA